MTSKISDLKEENGKTTFTISNIDVSYVKIWFKYVYNPYKEHIEEGNITFFLTKDYANDLARNDNSDKIMESIDRLRSPIKNMSPENQAKTMKYIQNLSKLAILVPQ